MAFANGRMLHLVAQGRPDAPHNKWDHFALSYSDLKAVTARLDALGVAWGDMDGNPRKPQTRPDGVTQVFVRDPDGYDVELNDAHGP